MVKRLNEKQINYSRQLLRPKMLHIGCGAFHRAHQAVYADKLAEYQGSDWGYVEVSLQHGQTLIEHLREQSHLFSVVELDDQSFEQRVIGVIVQAHHLPTEGVATVIDALCQQELTIVSMTITEKGYCYIPSTNQLDPHHPEIIHDWENWQTPRTAIGLLTLGLAKRRERGLNGLSIVSCDNMPNNGRITRNVLLAYAKKIDPDLKDWIEEKVTFPSSMVDRIVPAMTSELSQQLMEKTGYEDAARVACEPFGQWVIEDRFVGARPAWELVGVQMVEDVEPYEAMKLRMLNGSHSFLAYLGYLAGYETIADCMQDPYFYQVIQALMRNEQRITLNEQALNIDLSDYEIALLKRFNNVALPHRTQQIAMDGSLKIPQRWLMSVRYHLAHQTHFPLLALGVAGWMRYVCGRDEKNQPIDVRDPLLSRIQQCVDASEEGESRVNALLSIQEIFGQDLSTALVFKQAVNEGYSKLLAVGSRATVKFYAEREVLLQTH